MTPQEERSLEIFKYIVKSSLGTVAIDREDAKNIVQIIADQEKDIEIWRQRCIESDHDYRLEHYRASLLEQENKKLKAFKSYFDELYGTGLDIAHWHLNGALAPFDDFYDAAVKEMEDN